MSKPKSSNPKKIKKPWWRHALEILGILLVIYGVMLWNERHLLSSENNIQAPKQMLVGLDDNVHSMPIENQKQLLYFFAPWCSICDLSIGNIETQKQGLLDKGYQVRYIALDWQSRQEVMQFAKDKKLTFPVLMGTLETLERYKVKGFPTYYLVNEKGEITAGTQGYSTSLGVWLRSLSS